MGGVEDDEPPSKRVKVSSGALIGLLNGTSHREQASCSLSDLMAQPLASQGKDEVVGSKGVVKKVELVRIIADALYSLGYKYTGAHLEEESGIPLQSSGVNLFMKQILDGKWDDSVVTLHKIGLMDETIVKLASFLILEQKFLELLRGEKLMDALNTLRSEIAPLCINNDRVRELSFYIVSQSQNVLDISSDQEVRFKSREKLLEELQKLLPSTVIIPERRLVHLLEQALDLQRDACRFHNSSVGEMSLFTDHQCGKDKIPSQTLQILQEHSDEVWFLQFSHNGKYLASSSSDCLVIIWEVKLDGRVSLKHRLSGHQKPVSCISWSPDDQQLLTCGVEDAMRRWDVTSGECLHIYGKNGLGFVSCGWAPDGKRIFSGVTDKSISMWDLEGREVECWKGQRTIRISDLGITRDGKELITVCKETTILLFGWESQSEKLIEESQNIVSFTLSEDSKFLLVSLSNQEIHLWNIDDDINLVAKFKGHKRSRFVLKSCFGGLHQAFIASGSEDSKVYIWHRVSGELVLTLSGHSGAVNCVSWNPANPHMLASASDDRTIRIWGLNRVCLNHDDKHSNGTYHCNGGT
ncbi:WD repeat-containing 26-like isoform X1 [Olea europaea subsp. europaea]|uniref:WD repeat-containing 26-like isoform X1 n=1 Tax=Olea europaea subsp. europaea TaxID=158383 RepID=A0A8S0P8G0_OLEEU|nr:WD repeat-containing 26-like isoform X1 [Olea europaea subsp. europaea]